MWTACPSARGRVGRIRKNIEKKAQLVGDGAASPWARDVPATLPISLLDVIPIALSVPLTRSAAGVPSCAGLCARSLRLPAVSPPLAAPPPSDVPPRESTGPLPTRASSEAARRSCSVLCARLMRTMRPAPASRGWLWRGPSPSSWGQFPRRPSIATFLRRSEASAPNFPRGFRGIGSSLASFLGRSDMERERLPLPDFSEGPPPGPRPRDIPVHGACVRGSRASGGSKKKFARRGGPPAFTRPGASSARAFVRDGLTSDPIASRPDPTRGGGVPTAAPPRASSRRTNLASRHVSNHLRNFETHPPPGEARVHSARRRGRARRGAHLLLDGDTHTLNARS